MEPYHLWGLPLDKIVRYKQLMGLLGRLWHSGLVVHPSMDVCPIMGLACITIVFYLDRIDTLRVYGI